MSHVCAQAAGPHGNMCGFEQVADEMQKALLTLR